MVRQALSLAERWTTVDGNFHFEPFYELILQLLEDEEDPWYIDLIKFWNRTSPEEPETQER